jgi:hypothetical protein
VLERKKRLHGVVQIFFCKVVDSDVSQCFDKLSMRNDELFTLSLSKGSVQCFCVLNLVTDLTPQTAANGGRGAWIADCPTLLG